MAKIRDLLRFRTLMYGLRMYFCTMTKRIFIVAGEMSGDSHGALLIEQIKKLMPDCIIEGIGGPSMHAKGLNSIADFSKMNVSGFWEVIKNYSALSNVLNQCKAALKHGAYDAFIAVDYPGFNMRLGKYARSLGIKSICYIAPQLWAWGKSRIVSVQQAYDILLTVLPFEERFFSECGITAHFVGHPLLDRADLKTSKIERDQTTICLMPGSRKQELLHHLPLLIPIAQQLQSEQFTPVFCIPQHLSNLDICSEVHRFQVTHAASSLLQRSRAGCVKMGTSTLEAALYDMPFISYYSTSFLSYTISKQKITLPWISLPNILLERPLIPELIQSKATSSTMLHELRQVLNDTQNRTLQLEGFAELRSRLGGKGASMRAAQVITDIIMSESTS